MNSKLTTHRSLQRALEVLTSFVPDNQKIGIAELSDKLGIHRSTISRILSILTQYGFVQKDTLSNKYSLGTMAVNIGHAVIKSLDANWITIAKPYVDKLSHTTHESVGLESLVDKATIVAYEISGRQTVQISPRLGDKLPRHAASGAKAIMAFSSPEFVDDFLKDCIFTSFTPNTITDPKILYQKLREYKQQGFSVDAGEIDIDVYAVAAPIFDHSNKPVGAVVILAPAYRARSAFSRKNISLLKKTAEQISSSFHFDKNLNGKVE